MNPEDNSEAVHRREATKKLSGMGKKFFHLIEFDESEELILEIRKHSFGLFLVELTGVFITVIILLATIILPTMLNDSTGGSSTAGSLILFVGFIFTILSIIGALISAVLYTNNVIFVTTDKIAQVLYTSLFSRKISQLSVGDIQDVTVSQNGIFPRIFNYGTLVIETAGEQQNYTFTYVPKPYENSKAIISVHENNLHRYGN